VTDARVPQPLPVPVPGGDLAALYWPADAPGAPIAVLLHDLGSDATAWLPVAAALAGPVEVVVPHLRGYGHSASLPGPYGVERHAEDVAALLASLGADRDPGADVTVLAGHGMGAFVAAMAVDGPARDEVHGLVFVDGGLPLPVPPGADLDAVLAAVLGLDPEEAPVPEALRVDGGDVFLNERVLEATTDLPVPAVLLWATEGLVERTPGLYDETRLAELGLEGAHVTARPVPGCDHGSLLSDPRGVEAVADAVRAATTRGA
jgi:pimeloyl-ACP methyl ester carboxylesterase